MVVGAVVSRFHPFPVETSRTERDHCGRLDFKVYFVSATAAG